MSRSGGSPGNLPSSRACQGRVGAGEAYLQVTLPRSPRLYPGVRRVVRVSRDRVEWRRCPAGAALSPGQTSRSIGVSRRARRAVRTCRTGRAAPDRAQAARRGRVRRHVGQERDARARVGAPGREPAVGRLHDRCVGSHTARCAGDPTRSSPAPCGRAPPAASRHGRRPGTRRGQRSAGRASWWNAAARTAAQGSSGVTGESEPNASGMPAPARSANGLSAAARPAPRRAAYMPVRAAPGCVEAGLDAEMDAEQDERRERRRVDHLGVLQPGPCRATRLHTLHVDRGPQPDEHLVHRPVADDVEPACTPRGRPRSCGCRPARPQVEVPRCRARRRTATAARRCVSRASRRC